jgi:hypothetical protein
VRKARADREELPVCKQFQIDQRNSPSLRINNVPVLNFSISFEHNDDIRRAQEFVNGMRREKNITEAQIMTVSQIACQNSSNALSLLIVRKSLCSLTHDEINAHDKTMGKSALSPAQLEQEVNVVMNKNGNLTVHLRVFKNKVDQWVSSDQIVETDLEKSSFLAELMFEIDRHGKILEEIPISLGFKREITSITSI